MVLVAVLLFLAPLASDIPLAVLAASGLYLANALPLAPGTAARPGPGFFPLGVAVFGPQDDNPEAVLARANRVI